MILLGDCIERMAEMDEASVDAIVTDPPYGIRFMGKTWDGADIEDATRAAEERQRPFIDRTGRRPKAIKSAAASAGSYDFSMSANQAFQRWSQAWATEALRVLKPGGHLLAFGGTRTYHRLACAIEDAGFEIRDSVIWLYGSGFPKSLDVSKAIDKATGAEREVVGLNPNDRAPKPIATLEGGLLHAGDGNITAPATPEAQQWQGWGTALKPAHEPIVLARKPLIGTVAQNVLTHGTGAINVDGCRIEGATGDGNWAGASESKTLNAYGAKWDDQRLEANSGGRWPANVTLSHLPECERVGTRRVKSGNHGDAPGGFGAANLYGDGADIDASGGYGTEQVEAWRCAEGCPVAELDRQSGERPTGAVKPYTERHENASSYRFQREKTFEKDADTGGASRFFYTAKASRAERNAGLDGFEERLAGGMQARQDGSLDGGIVHSRNHHPTVKPIDLMRWLVRLVTPLEGTILDPFCGSGTTGIAATLEGFSFVGIEREAEYAEIAKARIAWWERHPEGMELVQRLNAEAERKAIVDAGQLELL